MKTVKNDMIDREDLKKKLKKPYKIPKLTVHGDLREITAAKTPGGTDALHQRSA